MAKLFSQNLKYSLGSFFSKLMHSCSGLPCSSSSITLLGRRAVLSLEKREEVTCSLDMRGGTSLSWKKCSWESFLVSSNFRKKNLLLEEIFLKKLLSRNFYSNGLFLILTAKFTSWLRGPFSLSSSKTIRSCKFIFWFF